MLSSVTAALQANIETFNAAAQRASRPERNDPARDIPDLMVAERAVEASINALRQLYQTDSHVIDLLA